MVKLYLILLGFLLSVFTPMQVVKAESISKLEPELYMTTEDIILDIVFPTIDKKVQKEYNEEWIDWEWRKIVGIDYNNNHSYDVAVRIRVSPQNTRRDSYLEDLVKIRISPSCDSNKMNKKKCNHDFKIELLEYKHDV
jgi:hypothetical protein